MTAPIQTSTSKPRSRRALLAGALGGVGAWAVGVASRANPAQAASGDPLIIGVDNTSTSNTSLVNTNPDGGVGLGAQCVVGGGLFGASQQYVGIVGRTFATNQPAIRGEGDGNHTGVVGYSGNSSATPPVGNRKTGVYGYAAQDTLSKGVWGHSPKGQGVRGSSDDGWAGYFDGKVFTNRFIELAEIANPQAPNINRARLFLRDVAGRTQLCVRFHNGAIRVLASS